MNRRDALAALVSLPALKHLSVVNVKPTDVIVAECEGALSHETISHIRANLEIVWPGRKIIVCEGHIRLKVLRNT